MPSNWKLALVVMVPFVLASPLRPRLEQHVTHRPTHWPTPTNTFIIPGLPTGGGLVPDPVYPGGPIVADPGQPGGGLTPDPTNPGGPINPDNGQGDEDSLNARDNADYPPPSFGFGPPTVTLITPGF